MAHCFSLISSLRESISRSPLPPDPTLSRPPFNPSETAVSPFRSPPFLSRYLLRFFPPPLPPPNPPHPFLLSTSLPATVVVPFRFTTDRIERARSYAVRSCIWRAVWISDLSARNSVDGIRFMPLARLPARELTEPCPAPLLPTTPTRRRGEGGNSHAPFVRGSFLRIQLGGELSPRVYNFVLRGEERIRNTAARKTRSCQCDRSNYRHLHERRLQS